MKNLILILLVFGLNTFSYSYNDISYKKNILIDNSAITTDHTTDHKAGNCDLILNHEAVEKSGLVRDCTLRLNMTTDDGTTIVGTLTFVGVSWFDCQKLTLVAWWTRNF